MTSELLTDADVAARLGVGERWIAEAAKAGRIPHIKLGRKRRFKPEHLDEIVAAFEERPKREGAPRQRTPKQEEGGVVRLERKTPRRLRDA